MYINTIRTYIPKTCKVISLFIQDKNLFKVEIAEQDLMSVQKWVTVKFFR